jgi:hypothetical protein
MMRARRMKGMKWVIALNAALVGIVILIGGVFACSLVRAAVRQAPVAPAVAVEKPELPQPLEVPPVCTYGVDFRKGVFLMKVINVSDEPIFYSGSGKLDPILRVDKWMSGNWVEGAEIVMCGLGIEQFSIEPGDALTFREAISGMRFPVRFYRTFSAASGRSSEMFLGEYSP